MAPKSRPSAAAAGGNVAGSAASASAAGRSSSPAAAKQPSSDLTPLMGLTLRVTLNDDTPTGTSVEGQLWAYDAPLGVVVLEVAPTAFPAGAASVAPSSARTLAAPAPRTAFRILKERAIKSVQVVPTTAGVPPTMSSLGAVNLATVEARVRSATQEAFKRHRRIGVGVTREAQDIYDALDKTWHEQRIIVMDEIIISPPYDTASTTVPSIPTEKLRALADDEDVKDVAPDARAKARSWAQVVKVLEGERRKIKTRAAAEGRA